MKTQTFTLGRGKALAGACALVFSAGALAGGHTGGGAPGADGFVGPSPDSFYWRHGFEGRTTEMAEAIVATLKAMEPTGGVTLDFTPEQTELLGRNLARVIKTVRNDVPYQHEGNDALIKATLTSIQFAKDNDMLEELIDHEVRTQTPMIARVSRMIDEGANPELALIAMTSRTACWYHLVEEYVREGMTIRWRAPYGNVLAVSVPMGQHDMTEQEVHDIYTIPLLQRQAAVMGMELDISPVGEDGWITMTMNVPDGRLAAVN
ncbi:MAG: hypothetical protein JJT85_08135 [Chromatiales bacterium]|nr:hypothetical protein [Chromatiales bacterium]